MKSKLLKIAISFITVLLVIALFSQSIFIQLGIYTPHVGLLFVLGLLFGPYGALGATLADLVMDLINGSSPATTIFTVVINFGVSYLAYKLWYTGLKRGKITKPRLDNIHHLTLFLSSIIICGIIYSAVGGVLAGFEFGREYDQYYVVSYFLNFINIAFIFGIPSIWLSKKIDFVETPKISKRSLNKKLYRILFYLLLVVTIISAISLVSEQNTSQDYSHSNNTNYIHIYYFHLYNLYYLL